MVDWQTKTDYLRCSPMFHKSPRYDFIIADLPNLGVVFAQLVMVFVCCVDGHDYQFALVQRLEKVSQPSESRVDKNLSIHRWHIRDRKSCEVIPVDRIVRGAVLLEDSKFRGDYFVLDTLDEDMFLRVNKLR